MRVRRDVFADVAALRLVGARAGRFDPSILERVEDEVAKALPLFEERGWVEDPASYHREPPIADGVRTRRVRSGNLRYTAMSWRDGYEPRPDEPGAERYTTYRANRIARAAVLEHRSGDRPWLICVHGFGMGSPGLDLRAFRALHLHKDLGLNLALLTLPFHGRRNPGGPRSTPAMPSVDVLDNVHGLEQSVWDVRQLMGLLRTRTSRPIGVMGLSLGGGVAATVASVDEPHSVLLLVPAVDLPSLAIEAAERLGGSSGDAAFLDERTRPLMRPVSPLALTPRVPVERRGIITGTLDQFANPTTQAVALWRHWDEPELHWYHGGHVSLFWSPAGRKAIDANLARFGLT